MRSRKENGGTDRRRTKWEFVCVGRDQVRALVNDCQDKSSETCSEIACEYRLTECRSREDIGFEREWNRKQMDVGERASLGKEVWVSLFVSTSDISIHFDNKGFFRTTK
jgi:hypothetical protein